MGHDHHFLSRLDRIASAEVELALSLYRDHELIHEVLSHAKLPEQAERVAISLDDPNAGPFIIVARNGAFVTCLGRDMSPGALPVITRKQLDAIAVRVQKLRERLQLAVSLTGGRTGNLLGRIFTSGPRLTREEMMGISAMQPLLFRHFLLMIADCTMEVHQTRVMLRNVRKPKHREEELLRLSWDCLWAVGHLTALVGIDGREHFEALDPKLHGVRDKLLHCVFQQCVFAISARGVWTIAKVGKPLLPTMKRAFSEKPSYLGMLGSALGLGAIGHRHSRLRAEARKALSPAPLPPSDPLADSVNDYRVSMRQMVEQGFEQPAERAEQVAIRWGRLVAHHWLTKRGVPGSPHRYATPEDVPDDVARAFACWHWGNTRDEDMDLRLLFTMLPWIVQQSAEDLFLPEELMSCLRFPDDPGFVLEVLKRPFEGLWLRRPQTIRVPKTPGRNDPCLCGSGKKHKKCCGSLEPNPESRSCA